MESYTYANAVSYGYLAFLGEAGTDPVAQRFAVDRLAFERGLGGFDYRAHLLDGACAGFRHSFSDGRVHFSLARTGGQIRFDDGQLFGFLCREVVAVAFCELINRFFALLHERLQDLDGFGFIELAELLGFLVGDRGLDHAEDAEAQFVFRAHGVGEIFLNCFGESHGKEFNTESTEGTENTKAE